MTECIGQLDLDSLRRKHIDTRFDADDISSDGGLALLAAVDERSGLIEKPAKSLVGERDASRVVHPLATFVMQRAYWLVGGPRRLQRCRSASS